MSTYRRLSYQPLSTSYHFKPDRPFDRAITAKGNVLLKLTIAGTEYGPYSIGLSTRKNTWEDRHSVRPRPTSRQLKESLSRMESLIGQAHTALKGEPMTGDMLVERIQALQVEGNQTPEKPKKEKISYRIIIHRKLSVRFAFRPTVESDESDTAPGQVEVFLWLNRSDGSCGPFPVLSTNRSIWMGLNMLTNSSPARIDLIRAKQRITHQIELAYLTFSELGLKITGEMIMDQVKTSKTS